ncbi:MAG: sulfate adenylyltransferase subunit CysN [Longimicrobiales bacterium]|nr:sulfate adenylyltransferase subunit CysN [Longimicrobiales bacterium]
MASETNPSSSRPMDLLRFSTAGSVDDGKSTLIGRLLYDTKSIFEDQLEAVEETSKLRGEGYVNLALLTDGLRAEREQNITIDVAYRYFATPRRKFIIADTPGHIQYTRNMVTGASTAELAIILIDARNGVLTQSKRHGFISSLLGIPHVLVAVNKMDLVDWSQDVYEEIEAEYTDFADKLGVDDLSFIPISALYGDNVVDESENMPWYKGSTLLHHLEHVNVGSHRNLVDFRFPVQYVIRPDQNYRGYAGRIASGAVRPGEEILVLPSRKSTTVASVDTFEGSVDEAVAGDSIAITTTDELDISRGDMIVRPMNLPDAASEIDATICWTSEEPMKPGTQYWLRQTTREVKAFVNRVVYRIDVDTLHRDEVETFGLNDIGRVHLTTSLPIFFDRYDRNRETGSFILIDPHTNNTVAAGMIRGAVQSVDDLPAAEEDEADQLRPVSPGVVWESWNIDLKERERRAGHKAGVVWFTGLSGSGKSSIARRLERRLFEKGMQTMLLDGDQVRHGLNGDLGFTPEDRTENIRRIGELASLFFRQGSLVLCTFVSPFREDRERARGLIPEGRFVEVFVDTPLEECERRDPKGLYAKARAGEIAHMTGISSPYEAPEDPEVHLETVGRDPDDLVAELIVRLRDLGVLT